MKLSCLFLAALVLSAATPIYGQDTTRARSPSETLALQKRLIDGGCFAGPADDVDTPDLAAAVRACPTQDPMLRVETGMHIGPIKKIDTDAACSRAATVADDKSIRVWTLPDGHLLQTIRLPTGMGHVGDYTAVALSPDGRTLAAAGWDGRRENGMNGLYLVDLESREVRRVDIAKDEVFGLAFSKDGTRVAAALSVGGIRVVDVASGDIVMTDRAYRAPAYAVLFGADGSLYAGAWDGRLRRYEPERLRRVAEVRGAGTQPVGMAVDPAGRIMAVGYRDSQQLDLLDARTLRRIGAAETRDLLARPGSGSFEFPAWLADGTLIASGNVNNGDRNDLEMYVRLFDASGRRLGDDRPIARDSVLSLQACGGDKAIFATGIPSFGFIGKEGAPAILQHSRKVDMRNKLADAFQVSPDGERVYFGLGFGAEKPVVFDLQAGTLSQVDGPPADVAPPDVSSLPLSGWRDMPFMYFGRDRVILPQYDMIHAVAARPDRSAFVIGGEHAVFLENAVTSHRQWYTFAPATTWGVNLAQNGDLVLAAFGDGTIRWFRGSDGTELLALFVDASSQRWVAWTPSGYYMASPGGEDLIGWNVNRGWAQLGDFFPASRFHDRFNRPDVVRLVLRTRDEVAAVKEANATSSRREDRTPLLAQLPPTIRIVAPAGSLHVSDPNVKIDYAWRSPSGQPVDRIVVLIDGREVKDVGLPLKAVGKLEETAASVMVALRSRDSEVGLIAWSGDSASQVARVRLTWDGAPAATSADRKLFALVVGVSDYVASDEALHFAAKDARDFAALLARQKGAYYGDVATRVLTDRAVTRASFIEGLKWLKKMATSPDDVGLLFIAGHGLTDEQQVYWYLPADATVDNVETNGVSQDEIRRALQSLPGKVLWFLDTCHAGAAAKRPVDVSVLVNRVSAAENGGIVAFASSTGREVSEERPELGNGAFTRALMDGIEKREADLGHDGNITTSLLDFFLERRVPLLTDGRQHPVMVRPPDELDFTVAKVGAQ